MLKTILDDLLAAKLVHLMLLKCKTLENKTVLKEQKTSTAFAAYFPPNNLPPSAVTILRRAQILDDHGFYSNEFLDLVDEGPGYLEARLSFLLQSINDYLALAEDALWRPERFIEKSSAFSTFDYALARETNSESSRITQTWSTYVSALSHAESKTLVAKLSQLLSSNAEQRILEPGGNLGVFAEAFLSQNPDCTYTVLDLPQVVELAREKAQGSHKNLDFLSGDMFTTDFSTAMDFGPSVIIFKSVLHDWNENKVFQLLSKSLSALEKGGRIVIAERSSFSASNLGNPHLSDVANFIFAPFYRDAEVYYNILRKIDASMPIRIEKFMIDMVWFILLAEKR